MHLGYQNGKINFYTEQPLDKELYNLDKVEYTDKEYIFNGEEYVLKDEVWEEKQAQKERERLSLLSMTKREMFLGLYQAKGITPDMLKAQITDPQALIEFEYANDYYRGNPLIDIIGAQLGFTTEQLDKFFETKDYTYLLPSEQVEGESEQVSEQVGDKAEDNNTGQASDISSNNPVVGNEVTDENTTDTTNVSNEIDTTVSEQDEINKDSIE